MPQIALPFPIKEVRVDGKHLTGCGLVGHLPPPLREASREYLHLLEYFHLIEERGIPQFYPKLSRELGAIKRRNLIYPIGDGVFIHIYSDVEHWERDFYISVEPTLTLNLDELMEEVERRLLDFTEELSRARDEKEKREVLLRLLEEICVVEDGNGKGARKKRDGKIPVSPREFQGLRYLIIRDKIGLGVLEPMIQDPYIEDISCSGLGPLFIEHKIFKGLRSAVTFSSYEELDKFVLQLAERIGKPVTLRNPIVDATLPDGSRINIVYGRDVSKRGSNFTIRKFSGTPLSILELIELGTLDYMMAAYLSLVIEEGMNVFISGETASGKTTTLNALTTFIPPDAKVVSIEDTPELQVPHKNWVREVVRGAKSDEKAAEVTMFDLLKAALRQRPNVIIVGEIRGKEGNIAFQAMQTGHAVMATFHAASVEKLIQRLTGDPINVPRTYIDNLNVVVIQSAVKLPEGRLGRRVLSINEIVGYDSSSDSFSFIEIFRWNPSEDKFEFVGDMNSYLLEQKIALKRRIPPNKKRQIYGEVRRRARVLERLHREKKVRGFYELLEVLARAQKEGIF